MSVKLGLSKEKMLEFYFIALCNGASEFSYYGVTIDVDGDAYNEARAKLDNPAIEEIYIQVLKDGNALIFRDDEGDETVEVTLEMVYERMPTVDLDTLLQMVEESDDAETADIILQTIAYGEVQFG